MHTRVFVPDCLSLCTCPLVKNVLACVFFITAVYRKYLHTLGPTDAMAANVALRLSLSHGLRLLRYKHNHNIPSIYTHKHADTHMLRWYHHQHHHLYQHSQRDMLGIEKAGNRNGSEVIKNTCIFSFEPMFHFIDLPSRVPPSFVRSSPPSLFLSLFHTVCPSSGVGSLIHIQCRGHLCASNMHGPACRSLAAKLTASQCSKRMPVSF